jgi:hypothetical protein
MSEAVQNMAKTESAAPQALTWTRGPNNAPWWDAQTGHRVLACRVRDHWVYLALGPDRAAGWSYRDWSRGEIPHWSGQEPKARYKVGERIPQPRVLLGRADSAEAARALCAKDATAAATEDQTDEPV